jgi:capsular exopolysaccharide synthesis family protein
MSKLFDAIYSGVGDRVQYQAIAEPGWRNAAPKSTASMEAMAHAAVRTVDVRLEDPAIFPFAAGCYAGEQYRMIRTRILQVQQNLRKTPLLLISSAMPGDGKTTTALNISGILALKRDLKVLLIDGDMVRSSVSQKLGLPNNPGLSEVLGGKAALAEAVVRIQGFPNFYVLPAGEAREDRAELLESQRWTQLCATARRQFGCVIIDSPPVSSIADYELLQAASDSVILVVRPDHTDRNLCSAAMEAVQSKLLGLVWNAADPTSVAGNQSLYYNYGDYAPANPKEVR